MMQKKFLQLAYYLIVVANVATADFAAPLLRTTKLSPLSSRLLTPIIVGVRSATTPRRNHINRTPSVRFTGIEATEIGRGGAKTAVVDTEKPPKFLKWMYTAAGAATTAAWSTMVYTTIRSNQPPGAMMPSPQHGIFARMGAMSAAGLIAGSFASLIVSASKAKTWEDLSDDTSFRRHNLALATTGVASSLWVRYAELVTRIPGTNPLVSHQSYSGVMQARLIGCYAPAALLGAAVWARCLPEDVRCNPLSWPKRIVDECSKSLFFIGPKNINDPVQVKYSLLTSSFLFFTAIQTVCNMPVAVIPSWTSRRLSRAFPIYTLLGAVTSLDLKEAAENGQLLIDDKFRYLSNGMKTFGGLYLGAKCGIFVDPSFPEHFKVVTQVPGLAVAAIMMVGLTLRSDHN